MTPARRIRAHRRGARPARLLALLAGLLAASVVPSPAPISAQVLADSVATRQRVYESELAAWQAAIRARQAAQDELGDAITLIERARSAGDSEALAQANVQAQARAGDVELFDQRVATVEERLNLARERLQEALDARLLRLQEQLVNATTPAERDRLGAFVEDLENRYRELEAEAEEGMEAPPEFYPALGSDPRDGRAQWEAKAGLLERKAATADTLITEAEETVERLQNRLRLEQARQDTRANRDRFGDALPPVGATGSRVDETGEIVSDTTRVPLESLPLDEQIVRWEAYIASLDEFRAILRGQAANFRRLLNRASELNRASDEMATSMSFPGVGA